MTPEQQLDEILEFIAKTHGEGHEKKFEPKQLLSIVGHASKLNPPIIEDDVYPIVQKLMKDKYVFANETNFGEGIGSSFDYSPTFEGKLFIQSGGYQKASIDNNIRLRQIELENSRNQLNQKLLVIGAIGAAVGALGLVGWEMYKFFVLECH